jgi:hypothetical protein
MAAAMRKGRRALRVKRREAGAWAAGAAHTGLERACSLAPQGASALGGNPLARRAIICCPTSLVGNWEAECVKWLKGRVR